MSVWPTALKLGCVTNLDMLFLVLGFISLVDEIQFMLISSRHICIRSISRQRSGVHEVAHLSGQRSKRVFFSSSDVNECVSGHHSCHHGCVNVPGSYICACDKGFRLDADLKSCVGKNRDLGAFIHPPIHPPIYLFLSIHQSTYFCVCMYVLYLCMYICMYVCMYACMYVCMFVCIYCIYPPTHLSIFPAIYTVTPRLSTQSHTPDTNISRNKVQRVETETPLLSVFTTNDSCERNI